MFLRSGGLEILELVSTLVKLINTVNKENVSPE